MDGIRDHAFTRLDTIRAASATNVDAAALNPEVFGFLTPETLLIYCQTKLRGLDEQIQRAMAGQKNRGRAQEALGELSEALDPNGLNGDETGASGKTKRDEVVDKYNKAIVAVGPETEMGKQLAANRDKFLTDASGKRTDIENDDAHVSKDDMRTFTDSVSQMQSQFNREGELEMIQLQSLMSQRQTALQMCTNMISGLGQSSQQIAANVGK